MSALVTVPLEQLVEAVARRVLEMLDERDQQPAGLVDAATLARLLGVSRATVYGRASELGAVQVGDGARPRLRFDQAKAREAWTSRHPTTPPHPIEPEPTTVRRRAKRARTTGAVRLLPVKGQKAA